MKTAYRTDARERPEPVGFPERPPIQRPAAPVSAAIDPDVVAFEQTALRNQRHLVAARWAIVIGLAFLAGFAIWAWLIAGAP